MIVVACPRSGTTSLAKMFGFLHEQRFRIAQPNPNPYLDELKDPQLSEVSWLAAPYVPEMLAAGVSLLHVVRHPLRVIASLCAMGFWEDAVHKAYREFVYSKVCACVGESPIAASALLWLRWNSFCEDLPRVRIEEIVGAPRLNVGAKFKVAWSNIESEPLRNIVLKMAIDYGYTENVEL